MVYGTYDLVNEAEVEWEGNVGIPVVKCPHHMRKSAESVRRHEIVEEPVAVR